MKHGISPTTLTGKHDRRRWGKLIWNSGARGTYNAGRNKAKRLKRGAAKALRMLQLDRRRPAGA